jgi:hypothetical protein
MMRILLTMVLLSLLVALPAQATDYSYSTSIDLSSPTVEPEGQYEMLIFTLPTSQPSFDLAVGDTLDGTITFDQAITFTNSNVYGQMQNLNLVLTGATGVLIESTQTKTFQGVTGSLTAQNPQDTTNGGDDSLFVSVAGMPTFTNTSVSFTGFTYTLTVTSETATGVSYTPSELTIMAPVGDLSIAPEPSTWAMLLGGLSLFLLLSLPRHLRRINSRGKLSDAVA